MLRRQLGGLHGLGQEALARFDCAGTHRRSLVHHSQELRAKTIEVLEDVENAEKAKEVLLTNAKVEDVAIPEPNFLKVSFKGESDEIPDLMDLLSTNGIRVMSFAEEETDLEDLFMRVTKGIVT